MLWFRKAARPRPVVRTRLRLESLADRIAPSGFGDEDPPLYSGGFLGGSGPTLNVAPQIVDFVGEEVGLGLYRFTGRVTGSATVGGLTITLGGVIENGSATTASDGTFSVLIPVQTDGSDSGIVTANTTADGLASNQARCAIDPST